MRNLFLIFIIIIFCNKSLSRQICKPPIIKSEKEINEKLKICERGDKILLLFDIKVKSEDLILRFCNLEHTIITKDEVNIVHKRGSSLTIICVYEPSVFKTIN